MKQVCMTSILFSKYSNCVRGNDVNKKKEERKKKKRSKIHNRNADQ